MAEQTEVSLHLSLVIIGLCFSFLEPPPGGSLYKKMSKSSYGASLEGCTSPSTAGSELPFRFPVVAETAASSSGHPSSSSGSGSLGEGDRALESGFDYDFVVPVDEKYECPICCFVLKNPNQTKCGHRFCEGCIKKWIGEKAHPGQIAHCPICSEPLTLNDLFSDNFAKREILDLKIYCPNKGHGCDGIIELRRVTKHQNVCEFAVVSCPNNCVKLLLRKDVEEHLQTSCERRKVPCTVCQLEIFYENQEIHLKTDCPKVEVACELCTTKIPRSQLKAHMNDACPNVLVECNFSKLGCTTKIERDQLDTHLHLSIQAHLKMMADTIESIKETMPSSQTTMIGSPSEFPGSISGPLTLPSFTRYQQSISIADSGVASTMPRQSTSSGFLTHPTSMLKEPMVNVAVLPSRLPQHLDSMSLNIPTGYSDPLPSTGQSSLAQEFQLHSASERPRHQRLVRQTSLGYVEEKLTQNSSPNVISQSNLSQLYERLKHQDLRLERQQQLIISLESQGDECKRKIDEQQQTIQKLEERLYDYSLRNSSGTFVWKVQNYYHKKIEAQRGSRTVIHSDGFYSSMYGYKLCVRLNLNGVESATGTHISLFVHFMQGEFDDILDWPFSGRISLAILDQSDTTQYRQHITETLLSKPTLAAFQKPHTHRNHKGFGYVEFSPLSIIEGSSPRYLKNDTIFIKVKVETN